MTLAAQQSLDLALRLGQHDDGPRDCVGAVERPARERKALHMVAIGRHRSPDVVTLDAVRCSGCRKSRDQPAGTHVKSRDAMRRTWGAAGDRPGLELPSLTVGSATRSA